MIPVALAQPSVAPGGADSLDPPERLVIGSVRRWLKAPEEWSSVEAEFHLLFGDDECLFALNGLKSLLEILAAHARRTLFFHVPCCRLVSADERSLLSLIASLQHGRQHHAQAILRWLLPASHQARAYTHAFWLACGMADCGLTLKPPHVIAGSY